MQINEIGQHHGMIHGRMGYRYVLRRVSAPKVDMPLFRQIYRRRPFNNGSSSYFASKVPRFAHHMLTSGDGFRCLPHSIHGGHFAIPDAIAIVCYGSSASVRRCFVGMEVHSEAPFLIRLSIARQSERGKLLIAQGPATAMFELKDISSF